MKTEHHKLKVNKRNEVIVWIFNAASREHKVVLRRATQGIRKNTLISP